MQDLLLQLTSMNLIADALPLVRTGLYSCRFSSFRYSSGSLRLAPKPQRWPGLGQGKTPWGDGVVVLRRWACQVLCDSQGVALRFRVPRPAAVNLKERSGALALWPDRFTHLMLSVNESLKLAQVFVAVRILRDARMKVIMRSRQSGSLLCCFVSPCTLQAE